MRLFEIGATGIIVYHVTNKESLQLIKQQGLIPEIGENSRAANESKAAIHVFLDLDVMEDAITNWDTMDWSDATELFLISIKVNSDIVIPDPVFDGVGLIYDPIAASAITKIESLD
jgi:hypothetical protein